jgi:ABC-type sugar transport system substrate-binding protein
MKRRGIINAIGLISAAALMSTAYGSTAWAQEAPKLGVLIYNVGGDPWINVATSTFETKGKEMGFDVTVADGRNDVAQMNAAMEQFIVQGVDAIIVQPADPDSIVGTVQRALDAGIPVVAFSHSLSPDVDITAYVGSDEVDIGRRQAQMAVDALGGEGNVAIMTGILGTSPQLGRSQGEHEVFDAAPGIKVVEEQANDWQGDKTVSLIQNWLSKYPEGELDAVLAHGPELVAAAEYAKSQGRDEVKFFAVDYPEEARAAIQSGTLYATINQSPAKMATVALETVKTVLDGGTVEKTIMIDNPAITAENVEEHPAAY